MTATMNLFPATVVGPTGSMSGRAYISDGVFRMYVDGGGRKVQVAVNSAVSEIVNVSDAVTNVLCADGQTYQVMPGGGCGCGSPLKTYNPDLHGIDPPA